MRGRAVARADVVTRCQGFANEAIHGHRRSTGRGYRFFRLLFRLTFAGFGALDGRPSRRLRAWAFRRLSSCCGGAGFGRFVTMMSPSVECPRLQHKPLNKWSTPRRSASNTDTSLLPLPEEICRQRLGVDAPPLWSGGAIRGGACEDRSRYLYGPRAHRRVIAPARPER
jgi:hypothetical protein